MEKISSILPSNSRVKSVDLEDAHPVRPGSPTYGQPVGLTASTRDRLRISDQAKEVAMNQTLARRNPREEANAKIAADITSKFFNTRLNKNQPVEKSSNIEPMISKEQIDNINDLDVSPATSEIKNQNLIELADENPNLPNSINKYA